VGTKSVSKAVAILKEFSTREPLLGVSELARRLGVTKSTVHSNLVSLLEGGLVEQDPATRKYRLGIDVLELGYTVVYSDPLLRTALPYLYYLADQLEEAVYLGDRRGDEVATMLHVMSPDLREPINWYNRVPLHSTSSGKVLLAYADDTVLEALLDKGLPSYTEHTITDPDTLREELQRVRQEGFATCFEEDSLGLNAIAVPIEDPSGTVIAALAVLGPAYSLTRAKAMASLERLKAISKEITRKLR
jgi:IclR family KDG regulon transcriptional repressor